MLSALHGAGPPLAVFAAWCGRPASAMPGLLFLTGLVAAMMAFGAGTAPSLMLLGLGGAGLAARWRAAARRALAPLFLFDAAVLTAMAVALAAAP